MIEYHPNENMWEEYLDPQYMYVFTTNGAVKNNGDLVMGVGTALHVATMHPAIPKILGDMVCAYGNMPYLLPHNLISLPTKHHWKDKEANAELVHESLLSFFDIIVRQLTFWETKARKIKMPLPGAGAGKMPIAESKTLLEGAARVAEIHPSGYHLEVYYNE
jgi:hypothetical protein